MDKKEIRKKFRKLVLERDRMRCRFCGDGESPLDPHHITDRSEMPNGGYVIENGITLCDKKNGCHWKAEQYHITGVPFVGFHPNDLYKIIGSSYDVAFLKSQEK